MRTPYVIYIDPCDTCNFRCKFCPTGSAELMKKTKGRGHGPMDYGVYTGIIDYRLYQIIHWGFINSSYNVNKVFPPGAVIKHYPDKDFLCII